MWQPPRSISILDLQTAQQLRDGIFKELREIAWLASLVGGISIACVTLAVMLVQP
jgi:hypothetical protein